MQFATRIFFFVPFDLFVTRTDCTCEPVLMMYMSYDIYPCKDMFFGGFIEMPPIGDQTQNVDVNRHF